jgi:5-methylcytosine-specific restriction enzyme A
MTRLNTIAAPVAPATAFCSSPEWRTLVRDITAIHGRRCEDPRCDAPDVGVDQRLHGDHITELVDGGEPLDAGNVMLRCAPCHGRKTAQVARPNSWVVRL